MDERHRWRSGWHVAATLAASVAAGGCGGSSAAITPDAGENVIDTGTPPVEDAAPPDLPAPSDADASGAPLSTFVVGACEGAATGLASFAPSNLPAGFMLPALGGTEPALSPMGIEFDTDTGMPRYPIEGPWATVLAGTEDDSPRILYVNDLRIATGKPFTITGTRPLIIVAVGTVDIGGPITTAKNMAVVPYTSGAGGRPSPATAPARGLGPGGGGPGTTATMGAGGGGYCGMGGAGNNGGTRGAKYGSAELVPLLAGSSGGTTMAYGGGPGQGGPGGGALQITAGISIVIQQAGGISMPGGGGGSGGAILLEAPSVTVKGYLAANGGAGGIRAAVSRWGSDTPYPAPGPGNATLKAGDGSGGTAIDGQDATGTVEFANGGGGSGRIRINTACGKADVKDGATISPAPETVCASTGTLGSP